MVFTENEWLIKSIEAMICNVIRTSAEVISDLEKKSTLSIYRRICLGNGEKVYELFIEAGFKPEEMPSDDLYGAKLLGREDRD